MMEKHKKNIIKTSIVTFFAFLLLFVDLCFLFLSSFRTLYPLFSSFLFHCLNDYPLQIFEAATFYSDRSKIGLLDSIIPYSKQSYVERIWIMKIWQISYKYFYINHEIRICTSIFVDQLTFLSCLISIWFD